MQNQVRQKLGLIGLQRTGTNYVQQVLKAAVPDADFTDHLAWKHAFRDEAGDAPIGDKVVIVARHPVLWLQSCLLNSSKDIKLNRSEFFAEDNDPVIGFADLYTRFYGGWLEHKRTAGGYLLRYEDILERGSDVIKELFSDNFTVVDVSNKMMTLPQSVQLSSEDLQAVINRQCAVPKEVAGKFWGRLHSAVAADLGYDWLSHAVMAIERNDDKVFGRELDSRLADYLELLSKACLVLRERRLERLLRHYTRVNPKEDHYRAGKEWNLNLCWTKLGKLDLAIEHASRAVEFADLAPTRKGDVVWWIHHLGDLLARVGKQPEAIEKFREAARRDPSDFRHHYRLAQEYRRLKDRERMFESLNEAIRLNPNEADIVGFKVTALRDFDPDNAEILPFARRCRLIPLSQVTRSRFSGFLRPAAAVADGP